MIKGTKVSLTEEFLANNDYHHEFIGYDDSDKYGCFIYSVKEDYLNIVFKGTSHKDIFFWVKKDDVIVKEIKDKKQEEVKKPVELSSSQAFSNAMMTSISESICSVPYYNVTRPLTTQWTNYSFTYNPSVQIRQEYHADAFGPVVHEEARNVLIDYIYPEDNAGVEVHTEQNTVAASTPSQVRRSSGGRPMPRRSGGIPADRSLTVIRERGNRGR